MYCCSRQRCWQGPHRETRLKREPVRQRRMCSKLCSSSSHCRPSSDRAFRQSFRFRLVLASRLAIPMTNSIAFGSGAKTSCKSRGGKTCRLDTTHAVESKQTPRWIDFCGRSLATPILLDPEKELPAMRGTSRMTNDPSRCLKTRLAQSKLRELLSENAPCTLLAYKLLIETANIGGRFR